MELTIDDLRRFAGCQVYIKDRAEDRLLIGELVKVSLKGTNQYGQSCVLRFSQLVRFSETHQRWVKESPRQYELVTGSYRAARIAGEIVLTPGRRNAMIIFCARGSEVFDFHHCIRTWNPTFADLSSPSESDDAA